MVDTSRPKDRSEQVPALKPRTGVRPGLPERSDPLAALARLLAKSAASTTLSDHNASVTGVFHHEP